MLLWREVQLRRLMVNASAQMSSIGLEKSTVNPIQGLGYHMCKSVEELRYRHGCIELILWVKLRLEMLVVFTRARGFLANPQIMG